MLSWTGFKDPYSKEEQANFAKWYVFGLRFTFDYDRYFLRDVVMPCVGVCESQLVLQLWDCSMDMINRP